MRHHILLNAIDDQLILVIGIIIKIYSRRRKEMVDEV